MTRSSRWCAVSFSRRAGRGRAGKPRRRRVPAAADLHLPGQAEQLRLARQVQEALLPPPQAVFPGAEVAARFLPSRLVGGDFCDYFQLGRHLLCLYLGDVQGKGLEGAMYALLVSGLMRGTNKADNEPASLVGFLNRRICLRGLPGKFCALNYAQFDLERRRLTLTSAGLPFPLLLRGQTLQPIDARGVPVGIFQLTHYDQVTVDLQPGDRILFYTDGVPDSLETLHPRAGDGEKQLHALLARHANSSAAALADALAAHLQLRRNARPSEHLQDDATFLVVRLL